MISDPFCHGKSLLNHHVGEILVSLVPVNLRKSQVQHAQLSVDEEFKVFCLSLFIWSNFPDVTVNPVNHVHT